MDIHIGSIVKKVMQEKRVPVGWVTDGLGIHLSSMGRIYRYESMQTEVLKKLCILLDYDFFAHYSEDINIKKVVIDTTSATEKLLAESNEENVALKLEIGYLKEINALLKKK